MQDKLSLSMKARRAFLHDARVKRLPSLGWKRLGADEWRNPRTSGVRTTDVALCCEELAGRITGGKHWKL